MQEGILGHRSPGGSTVQCNEAVEKAESQFHGPSFEAGYKSGTRDSIDPIDWTFTYHRPTGEQQKQYEVIREAAKHFARLVLANTPSCPDRSVAIRKIREAVMTANAAIALEGRGL